MLFLSGTPPLFFGYAAPRDDVGDCPTVVYSLDGFLAADATVIPVALLLCAGTSVRVDSGLLPLRIDMLLSYFVSTIYCVI